MDDRRLSVLRVDGTDIRVSVRGEGPPLLLIMGLGGYLEMWDPLERALNARGITTIAYDAPGTGRSPARLVPQSMGGLARQAAHLLHALGHEAADVLGLSFGGAVAQELTLAEPSSVRRLVLASATCGLGAVPGNPLALLNLAGPLRRYSPTYLRVAADALRGPATRVTGGQGEPVITRRDKPPTMWGYLGQLAAATAWTSLPRLHRIQCPTLLLAGEKDSIVPAANSRILASRIPHSRLEILQGADHLLLMDDPRRCAAIVADFLEHLPRTS